ncbi:kin of irre-like protein 1, partial [Biomphalaria glabrata]
FKRHLSTVTSIQDLLPRLKKVFGGMKTIISLLLFLASLSQAGGQTITGNPEVSLSSDCYIPWARVDNCLVGTEGYCTCNLNQPSGRVLWVRSDGSLANQQYTDSSSKLIVTSSSKINNETFTCVWESALGKQNAQTFNVLYPKGPTTMSLRALGVRETFDLCPAKSNSITVVCEVPKDAVYPKPWFHFTVNGTIPVYDWYSGDLVNGVYRYNQTIKVERGGDLSVYCWPGNSCTRSVSFIEKTLKITVREPPSNYPEITINGKTYTGIDSSAVNVQEGTRLIVSCKVSGGMPAVKEVTLTCGAQQKKSSSGGLATLSFNASRKSLTRPLCSCRASHVTGCYDKQTFVRLNVAA